MTVWDDRARVPLGRLASIKVGSGPSLVLIHGVGLRSEAWGQQLETLADRYSITAIDMPGHGQSPPLNNPANLAAFTDAIAAELQGTSLIVGHSMGALIALDIAARYPKLVLGVGAMNAVYRRTDEATIAIRARAEAIKAEGGNDPEPTLARWFLDGRAPAAVACRRWLTSVDPAAYKIAYTKFCHEDGPTDEGLDAIQCPALFMTGGDEPNSTPEMSENMAARVNDGTALIIPGAAHMMPMTHADAVNDAIIQLMEKCQK